MSADLRLGRYQDVLADVECDLLCVDAPYSERTHSGHDSGVESANLYNGLPSKRTAAKGRTSLQYSSWTAEDVHAFVDSWVPRTTGWVVSITDHVLAPVWASALETRGRYVFSPLAFVEHGSRVRLTGDGPAQWACWIVVCRPKKRHFASWGSLPGGGVLPAGYSAKCDVINFGETRIAGAKPLWLMRSLIRDYSRPGDLVCDPCAGGGTTLQAALMEGRRAVGAECLPEHYEIARKRLARGYTPQLPFAATGPEPEQLKLGGDE